MSELDELCNRVELRTLWLLSGARKIDFKEFAQDIRLLLDQVRMPRPSDAGGPAQFRAQTGITRAELLQTAEKIVTRDRQATHGRPEDSFARIAQLWSAYLGCDVQPHDVSALMALLKIARIRTNPRHPDNWVDLAGYAACGGETAGKGGAA